MMLVSMQDPGLRILPTHRLVSGIGDLKAADIQRSLGEHFDFETIGTGPAAAKETWDNIEADGSQGLLGFGTVADGVQQIRAASRRRSSWTNWPPTTVPPGAASASRSCSASSLDARAFKRSGPAKCQYVHLLAAQCVDEAPWPASSANSRCWCRRRRCSTLEQIAGNFEKMPVKSTYFYPKLLAGLVFHSLTHI